MNALLTTALDDPSQFAIEDAALDPMKPHRYATFINERLLEGIRVLEERERWGMGTSETQQPIDSASLPPASLGRADDGDRRGSLGGESSGVFAVALLLLVSLRSDDDDRQETDAFQAELPRSLHQTYHSREPEGLCASLMRGS